MSRVGYSVRNAKVSLTFYMLLLVLNFFSRRVFIDTLGNELVGLSTTVLSYIGFLNLAEMGISVAIANALYAPIFGKNRAEITDIVSLFGYLFRLVGIFIGVAGLIFALFIPQIFGDSGVDLNMVYAAYFSFLVTTLLSYLVNYKQNLLVANQKNYVITKILNTCTILKVLLQMALLVWFEAGYIMWLALEIVFGVVFSVWLELVIRREYPWLRSSAGRGRAVLHNYPAIFGNIKRVFSHKIAGFVLQQTDPILISILSSLSMVTYYGNYMMIINRVTQLVSGTMINSYAGVGNLVAEGDHHKIKLVFWQFNALYLWIGGVVVYAFFTMITPFIPVWLGSYEYVLPQSVLTVLVLNLFITMAVQPVLYFINAYGLYNDVWASWSQTVLNLAISIVAGYYYGLIGIVLGTAVSTGIFTLIWKPYFLYRSGFAERSREYWLTLAKYIAFMALNWVVVDAITNLGWLPEPTNLGRWAVRAVAVTVLFAVLYGSAMYATSSGMRYLVQLWRDLWAKKFKSGK